MVLIILQSIYLGELLTILMLMPVVILFGLKQVQSQVLVVLILRE
jgi:hypothetical protein